MPVLQDQIGGGFKFRVAGYQTDLGLARKSELAYSQRQKGPCLLNNDWSLPQKPQGMESFSPPSPGFLNNRRPPSRDRPLLPRGPRIRHRPSGGLLDTNFPIDQGPASSSGLSSPSHSDSPTNSEAYSYSLAPVNETLPTFAESHAQPLVQLEHEDPPPSFPEIYLHPRAAASDAIVNSSPKSDASFSPSIAPSVRSVPKPTTLTMPPKITFDSVPIAWKGLPLEAAQWTFTSEQLQGLVSRAIRLSAQESFIRLLSPNALSTDIPAESERLESLKAMTQAKYRFHVQRRSMLLQGLNAFAMSSSKSDASGVVGNLTVQLSECTAAGDKLMEELLHIADQQAQIARVQDVHSASALAVALRKLNGSYAKRTSELKAARQRIASLEAELEEAWHEAEKIAQEIDEFEDAPLSDEEGEDETELVDASIGNVVNITGMGVVAKATLLDEARVGSGRNEETRSVDENKPPEDSSNRNVQDEEVDDPDEAMNDAATIRSTRSGRSGRSIRSTKSGEGSRTSRVTSARKRSTRISNASLRLPRRSNSNRHANSPSEPAPPVPVLPNVQGQGRSFLDFDTPRHPSRMSTDDMDMLLVKRTVTAGYFDRQHPFSAGFDRSEIPPIWTGVDGPPRARPSSSGGERVHSMQALGRSESARLPISGDWGRPRIFNKRLSAPLAGISSVPAEGLAGSSRD